MVTTLVKSYDIQGVPLIKVPLIEVPDPYKTLGSGAGSGAGRNIKSQPIDGIIKIHTNTTRRTHNTRMFLIFLFLSC